MGLMPMLKVSGIIMGVTGILANLIYLGLAYGVGALWHFVLLMASTWAMVIIAYD